MEAPCKRYNRSLQFPRATVSNPPPSFVTGPSTPLSPESFTPLPPFFETGLSTPLSPESFTPLPPTFEKRPSTPLSPDRFTPPPPFCGFRFCEGASLLLTNDHISVLWNSSPNGKQELDENPFISTTPRQFLSECDAEEGLCWKVPKWLG
ncbi:hypothetical protein AVEN_171413-1 [Araneus ventricosus]|uniref:Uncharacterized protein n=1 Tax=Araneus ventricosus TaxID=182803 RepID=A0A4Y2D4L7_ARAVE|nr:hypothetical protein AVEN_171413-1 [Araneus ventricosus]